MPPKSDAAFLWDMIDAAEAVVRFVSGSTLEAYTSDDLLRAAGERKVEIIGEAARGVSDALKQAHPEIPWRKIVAQRHVLAHEYGIIDDEAIWRVATIHIPLMLPQLRPLLPPQP